ncbi:hypothetical protein V8J82_20635 [Gymnodinialimonas sp. 2305UL16-5]|uniref:hypothetical protein n=1 Tax=Gymnodinialimonas mytili TaxID=3126503 RepID=UPI0030B7C8F0
MALHPSVQALHALGKPLRDDDFALIEQAHPYIDALPAHPTRDDVAALLSMLPANGDTASGLNWTILHRIEASPDWPIWDLLDQPEHEWHQILRQRLMNGGVKPPSRTFWQKILKR